jgi:hypothetical protein
MNHSHAPARPTVSDGDAARGIERLRTILALIERMASAPADGSAAINEASLEESARLAIAYANAPTITRRRYEALAGETAAYAAAGLAALIRHTERTGRDCAPAAAHLAAEMRRSIATLAGLLGRA